MKQFFDKVWNAKSDGWGMFFAVIYALLIGGAILLFLLFIIAMSGHSLGPEESGVRWKAFLWVSKFLLLLYLPFGLMTAIAYSRGAYGNSRIGLVGLIMTVGINCIVALIVFSTDTFGIKLTEKEEAAIAMLEDDCQCEVELQYSYDHRHHLPSDSLEMTLTFNYSESEINHCFISEHDIRKKSREYLRVFSEAFDLPEGYKSVWINFYAADMGHRSESPYCDRAYNYHLSTKKMIDSHESYSYDFKERQTKAGYEEMDSFRLE